MKIKVMNFEAGEVGIEILFISYIGDIFINEDCNQEKKIF